MVGRVGLAIAFALVCGRDVRQWQVPKAWARISPGCSAEGGCDTNLYS